MKPLTTGYIRKIICGKLVHGTDNLLIQHGAYRLKQVRQPNTILFLQRKIIKWERLKPYFPLAIVTDRELTINEQSENLTVIKVDDLQESYWKFINNYRSSFNIPVIAVTGTSGKTTTKEMIRHLLSVNWKVAYTNSTNNSRTAHLTYLLAIDEATDVAVFETAVGAPGDISKAAAYLKPTIGIITNIGEHHLNYCKSLEGYIAAKGEMRDALQPDGVLIINIDDQNTRKLDLTDFSGTIITIGIHSNCDYRASDIDYSTEGMYMTVEHRQKKYRILVPGIGEHQVYNGLAAIAAVHHLGMSLADIAVHFRTFKPLNKQLQKVIGVNGSTVIDDTWSITTTSLRAALKVLERIGENQKKIAVIGTITDLGSWGYTIHEMAGDIIAESNIHVLLTIGKHAKIMADTVSNKGAPIEVHSFNNHILAFELLKKITTEDSVVLIKGDMFSEAIKKLATLLRKTEKD
ncbi:UDP-N-acetylmuramoyl-tripeptide--D-alanyl-D-alanine ligase [Sporosarcina sp. ACRSL]|uniref:Mur ligase family protein n=1 Tax=Sporosarcina sp. ACRSL TaxID=2918215 RepID=UPI001EF5B10A|nr:UDP-N-acetylmuramoyl-tripeptide--D-alanyl-D-alanine ligase [Sporosarcina sp. ACRSL]MCG7345201.1 UDP-N-acetylmuramoyl-tripeptide--D-alanyl-D-alanine ligase [Sporosarcina sp. ACRSL]